jgi:hypothetical protein
MTIRLFSIFILLTFFINCTTDDSPAIVESALLTIELDPDYLSENDSFFYLIQNNAGETLPDGFGSLTNGETVIFEGNSNIETLNVSLFNYSALQNRVDAKTYLNIPAENTISLNSVGSTTNPSVEVQLVNRPNLIEEFNFSANNKFTPGSHFLLPSDENIPFTIGGYDQLETTFVTIEYISSSIPKYQILNMTNDNVKLIDYDNGVDMEVSHNITSTISDAELRIGLKGYRTSDFENPEGNHILYNVYNPSLVQNSFTIYSMDSFFSDYQLRISAEQDNFVYEQITNGSIPSTFTTIEPSITINQASFLNYEIISDDSFSTANSYWNLKDENGVSDLLRWNIYSTSNQSSFISLNDLPADLPSELEVLNSLEELNLESVKAIDVPGQDYFSLMNVIFEGSSFNFFPEVYSKTLTVQ